jgi:CheY-like chemotaxis protein
MNIKTLLIVDDNALAATALRIVFKLNGYRVLRAADGQSALEIASRRHPDLILTDWRMPVMNGVELCGHVRADPVLADTPLILMSSDTPPEAGCWDEYFCKPLDVSRLLAAVDIWLGAYQSVH